VKKSKLKIFLLHKPNLYFPGSLEKEKYCRFCGALTCYNRHSSNVQSGLKKNHVMESASRFKTKLIKKKILLR